MYISLIILYMYAYTCTYMYMYVKEQSIFNGCNDMNYMYAQRWDIIMQYSCVYTLTQIDLMRLKTTSYSFRVIQSDEVNRKNSCEQRTKIQ